MLSMVSGTELSRVALEGVSGKTNGESTDAVDRFMFTDDDGQPPVR